MPRAKAEVLRVQHQALADTLIRAGAKGSMQRAQLLSIRGRGGVVQHDQACCAELPALLSARHGAAQAAQAALQQGHCTLVEHDGDAQRR